MEHGDVAILGDVLQHRQQRRRRRRLGKHAHASQTGGHCSANERPWPTVCRAKACDDLGARRRGAATGGPGDARHVLAFKVVDKGGVAADPAGRVRRERTRSDAASPFELWRESERADAAWAANPGFKTSGEASRHADATIASPSGIDPKCAVHSPPPPPAMGIAKQRAFRWRLAFASRQSRGAGRGDPCSHRSRGFNMLSARRGTW